MRILLLAMMGLLTLSLTACETPEAEPTDSVNGKTELVNETDYSVCHISPAPHTIEGNWYMKQTQGAFRFVSTFQIRNGTVQMTNDCIMNGVTLRAQVMAPAYYDTTTFQPARDAHDERKIENVNFKMSCEANISAVKMNYGFEGNCLVFYQPGKSERMVLAPR